MLGPRDRHARAAACAPLVGGDPRALTFAGEATAAEGEPGPQHDADARRHRPAARAAARRDVEDLHARCAPPAVSGFTKGQRAGEVAGDEVVPERRQQCAVGPLRSRSVLVEHATNERTLPRRVEVVRAGVHGRLQRRLAEPQVRADGGHQHVTALDQRAHRAGTVDVGNRRFQAAELGGQSSHTVGVTTGQQRHGTTLHERASGQLACVPGRSEHHDPARPSLTSTLASRRTVARAGPPPARAASHNVSPVRTDTAHPYNDGYGADAVGPRAARSP